MTTNFRKRLSAYRKRATRCPLKEGNTTYLVSRLLFSLLLVFATSAAIAGHDAEPSRKAPDAVIEQLLDTVRETGQVRVIVGFAVDAAREKASTGTDGMIEESARIARKRRGLFERHSSSEMRSLRTFRHLPFAAMTVDASGLASLLDDPQVTSIEWDAPEPPTLLESTRIIEADVLWEAKVTGAARAVAVLDTGIETSHAFFSGRIMAQACFSTDDPAINALSLCPNGLDEQLGTGSAEDCPTAVDGCGHGTHVAGIAAGANGQKRKLHGVARGANIVAVQVFSELHDTAQDAPCAKSQMTSPCALSFPSDQVAALDYVLDLKLDDRLGIAAVNMSLGGGEFKSVCDQAEASRTAAIDKLRQLNVATVVSSGNKGYANALGAPACISSAVSVGSVDKTDAVSAFSNGASFLSFLAPGEVILSSVVNNQYGKKQGTSMAAPHVAGGFALLRQADPSTSVDKHVALLEKTGVQVTDPDNGLVFPRIDLAAALSDILAQDAFDELAILKGGQDGPKDYRMIVVGGPTPTSTGGLGLTTQEATPDDYWLDHWSPGRTVGMTAVNDINQDGFPDLAYLKGGANGATDYRLIVVEGPSPTSPGGQGLQVQESAPDDYWLNHWSAGRSVQVTSIKDISGDGYDDIAYLKGGANGATDYRLVVVEGPSPNSPGGQGLQVQESAPDDYWLNHWSAGRTVQVTAIKDISGDGYDDIAYLKGGSNGATDYRLIVVTGPTPNSPGGQGLQVQEDAPDDYWLNYWSPGRTVQVTAISDISGDGYDDLVYLKGGPAAAKDYRMIIVTGPSPNGPGGDTLGVHETIANDYWLDHWSPGRTVRLTAIR